MAVATVRTRSAERRWSCVSSALGVVLGRQWLVEKFPLASDASAGCLPALRQGQHAHCTRSGGKRLPKAESRRLEYDCGNHIHYRGKITDVDRVEAFEDRVVDMALEIGAAVRIWRSAAENDATRVVRGLILHVSPGQETTSLLIIARRLAHPAARD